MSNNALKELIAYRLSQAQETLEEARIMLDSHHFRAVINRAYYAMFYVIQALLAQKGTRMSKHSGAISFFDQEYVKKNRYDKSFSKWLHELFEARLGADYGELTMITEDQARASHEKPVSFVTAISSDIINKYENK